MSDLNWGDRRVAKLSQALIIISMIAIASLIPAVLLSMELLCWIISIAFSVTINSAIILFGKYLDAKTRAEAKKRR